jgi:hypothetical protein
MHVTGEVFPSESTRITVGESLLTFRPVSEIESSFLSHLKTNVAVASVSSVSFSHDAYLLFC